MSAEFTSVPAEVIERRAKDAAVAELADVTDSLLDKLAVLAGKLGHNAAEFGRDPDVQRAKAALAAVRGGA